MPSLYVFYINQGLGVRIEILSRTYPSGEEVVKLRQISCFKYWIFKMNKLYTQILTNLSFVTVKQYNYFNQHSYNYSDKLQYMAKLLAHMFTNYWTNFVTNYLNIFVLKYLNIFEYPNIHYIMCHSNFLFKIALISGTSQNQYSFVPNSLE